MDQIFRSCSTKYTFPKEYDDEIPLTIDKGVTIVISSFALHRYPKHFPNPEIFDPERFSQENRSKITPGSYLPFGSGQRNCIGKIHLDTCPRNNTNLINNSYLHKVPDFR